MARFNRMLPLKMDNCSNLANTLEVANQNSQSNDRRLYSLVIIVILTCAGVFKFSCCFFSPFLFMLYFIHESNIENVDQILYFSHASAIQFVNTLARTDTLSTCRLNSLLGLCRCVAVAVVLSGLRLTYCGGSGGCGANMPHYSHTKFEHFVDYCRPKCAHQLRMIYFKKMLI